MRNYQDLESLAIDYLEGNLNGSYEFMYKNGVQLFNKDSKSMIESYINSGSATQRVRNAKRASDEKKEKFDQCIHVAMEKDMKSMSKYDRLW